MSDELEAARRRLTERLMGREGISGTAVGLRDGRPCLKVYVTDARAARGVPKREGRFDVDVEVTGTFRRR